MLKSHQVTRVRELHEAGFSQRVIARKAEVARETVRNIISGRRPDYQLHRECKDHQPLSDKPPERCPWCGAFVYPPCYACRVRRQLRTKQLRSVCPDDLPLLLELIRSQRAAAICRAPRLRVFPGPTPLARWLANRKKRRGI